MLSKKKLESLKEAVFAKLEILAAIYKAHGQSSLFDYVSKWQIGEPVRQEALPILAGQLRRFYGENLVLDVTKQLSKRALISTIDHHGIWGHPFFLNSNLIFSLYPGLKYIICFSTAGVSLNNSSWPGCLFLTNHQNGRLERFSFFKDAQKSQAVLAAPAVGQAEVNEILEKIQCAEFLSAGQKSQLENLLMEIFLSPKFLNLPNFSAQACRASHWLWSKTFPRSPKLVYLPLEDITSEIIKKLIAPQSSHVLHRLFFSQKGWQLLEKYFFGLRGAFGRGRGSFLFWGIDGKGRRAPLHREQYQVIGEGIALPIEPDAISKALEEKKIYPTSLACFLAMLYYNFTCIGGFNQTTWFTEIKQKFASLFSEMGEAGLAKTMAQAFTANFAEGNLTYLMRRSKIFKPAALDIYLQNGNFYKKCQQLAKNVTLAQSIESLLPEIYRIAVPKKERQKALLEISDGQIVRQNGMARTIESYESYESYLKAD